jgi:DNA-binding ferritin-like protein (Dps family)
MVNYDLLTEPILFNPLKHYLGFIREFVSNRTLTINDPRLKELTRELKHIGTCVMDIYSGNLSQEGILKEILEFLEANNLKEKESYKSWTGTDFDNFKIVTLSDSSQWTLKYHNHETRYVHIFPARSSPHSFRIKANTLKSAILYIIIFGKNYVSDDDLNAARALMGLSPVKEVADAEAVTEMIEILRNR